MLKVHADVSPTRKIDRAVVRRRNARGETVIWATRLDGREFVINAEEIETVEATPDTVITLVSGRKQIVRESPDELVGRVLEYRRKLRTYPDQS